MKKSKKIQPPENLGFEEIIRLVLKIPAIQITKKSSDISKERKKKKTG